MTKDEQLDSALTRLAQVAHERSVLRSHSSQHDALAEILAQRENEQLSLVLAALKWAGYPTIDVDASEDHERRAIEDPESIHDELASMSNQTGHRVRLNLKRSPVILRRPRRKVVL